VNLIVRPLMCVGIRQIMARDSDTSALLVGDSDTQALAQFELRWRWTDRRWAEFSAPELAQIRCLAARRADQINDYLERTLGEWQTASPTAAGEQTIPTDGDPQAVCDWLDSQWSDRHGAVIVSWDQHMAVAVPWDLFVRRWDDFCYPSSDDVTIAPTTGDWILEYSHYEQMRWTPRPSAARPN
jgi:hypothetical protein